LSTSFNRAEYVKHCDPRTSAYSEKWYHPPAEIWLLAGSLIVASPGLLQARFADPAVADDLAHKILHTVEGAWHPTTSIFIGQ
jgi:hypothetical protein